MKTLTRIALATITAIALSACATPGSGFLSPGTTGAPATGTTLAQNARDQSTVPGTVTTGTAQSSILNQFAAVVDASTLEVVRDMAKAGEWTAEQTRDFLGALVDAPETVTISGNQTITNTSGDGENLGAGSGGSGAQSAGQVAR